MQMFIQKRKVELGAGMVMGKHGERSTKSQGFFWNEEIHTGILYPIDFFLNRHPEANSGMKKMKNVLLGMTKKIDYVKLNLITILPFFVREGGPPVGGSDGLLKR